MGCNYQSRLLQPFKIGMDEQLHSSQNNKFYFLPMPYHAQLVIATLSGPEPILVDCTVKQFVSTNTAVVLQRENQRPHEKQ